MSSILVGIAVANYIGEREVKDMKKLIAVVLAVVILGTVSGISYAGDEGWAAAGGLLGGLILGSAISHHHTHYYGCGHYYATPVYYSRPVYYSYPVYPTYTSYSYYPTTTYVEYCY